MSELPAVSPTTRPLPSAIIARWLRKYRQLRGLDVMNTGVLRPVRYACVLVLAGLPGLHARASGVVDVGVEYHAVDADLGDWRGAFVRGSAWSNLDRVVNYEFVDADRFRDRGRFAGLGFTGVFAGRWIVNANAGAGESDFIFPRWTGSASLGRKWLPDASLVTTLGGGVARATDGHRDRHLLLTAAWYAPGPWIFEGGVRHNQSDPGNVRSTSGFVAATWGHEGDQYWIARHDMGNEAYQLIAQQRALVDFPSRSTSLTWRKWLGPACGMHLQAVLYHNPQYDRRGFQAGIFCNH